jgi:hypothetical protein
LILQRKGPIKKRKVLWILPVLRYDSWHPAGCLFEVYGYQAIYDAGSSTGAKLSSIIREKDWYWLHARSDILVDIQSRLPEVVIGDIDQPVWKSKKGSYSCSKTWETLRYKLPLVAWWKVV